MTSRLLNLCRLGPCLAVVGAIVLLCGSSVLAPAQGDPLPKIGYLGFGVATPPTFFQKRMRELGYSEGKEVEVEYRFADGRPEKLAALARELVDAKVNVIVAIGDEAIVAAKNATRTIPIAMVACDAITTGFVASLARPGGNLTGVTCLTSELMPKRSCRWCRVSAVGRPNFTPRALARLRPSPVRARIKLALEFSQATENREHQPAVWRRGIGPGVFQAAETGLALANCGQDVQQVPSRPRQAV
jgi:ABC transporter substrate binding protein